jgi:hypothetical protein
MRAHRKMLAFLVAVGVVTLVTGLAFCLWPGVQSQPLLHLQLVRQTQELGQSAAVFRVQVSDRRRIQIVGAGRMVDEKKLTEVPSDPTWGGLWTRSHGAAWGDPSTGRNEFYVGQPTNAPVWRLWVSVSMEEPSLFKRARMMPSLWSVMRNDNHRSVPQAARDVWGAFYSVGRQELVSDLITNQFMERVVK